MADELAADVPPDIPVERLNARRLRGSLFRLALTLRRMKPQVVFSTLGYINLGLLALRPWLGPGVKLVVREANIVTATLNAMPRWLRAERLYSWLYPRAAAIIAQTPAIAAQIRSVAPAAALRIYILPNPVDQTRLRSGVQPSTGIHRSGLALVAAGRLTRQKGFDRLIALMPELPTDARLTIYGEGPERAPLQAQIASLGLTDRVTLAGFSKQLSRAISEADVFVLPSRWEGMPNVVLEALALGTPVVASRESGVEDIAAAAPGGAVIVANVDADFVQAICRHVPSAVTSLRPSVLPSDYRTEAVAARFNDLLVRVAAL